MKIRVRLLRAAFFIGDVVYGIHDEYIPYTCQSRNSKRRAGYLQLGRRRFVDFNRSKI